MQISRKINFEDFEPWSGAQYTWVNLRFYDRIGKLEAGLEGEHAENEIIDETQLNDLLWFDSALVYEWVGLASDGCLLRLEEDDEFNDFAIITVKDESGNLHYLQSYDVIPEDTQWSLNYSVTPVIVDDEKEAARWMAEEEKNIEDVKKLVDALNNRDKACWDYSYEITHQPIINDIEEEEDDVSSN